MWAVVGLTALAAAIRFSTLGLQSYRHDEAVTAGRVLVSGLPQTMHEVWAGESTPPLYYLLAWLWSHLVRRARGRPALALGAVRDGHRSGRLPGREGADRPPRRARRRGDRRRRADAGLVLAGRPRLRAARPAQHGRAALLPARPPERSGARPWLVGRLLRPGACHPLLRLLPARDRGRLAAGGGATAAPGAVGAWRRRPGRPRAGADRAAPGPGQEQRLDRHLRHGPPPAGGRDQLLRRRGRAAQACADPDGAVRRRGRPAADPRRGPGEAGGGGGADGRRGRHPARARLRGAGAGLRARAQPAAGADPAGAGRRGRHRLAARRLAGVRGGRGAGRLPARLLRLCGLPGSPAARRLASRGAGDRAAARPPRDPGLGAGGRTARLLHRRRGEKRSSGSNGAARRPRSPRSTWSAVARRRPVRAAPCHISSTGSSGSGWAA